MDSMEAIFGTALTDKIKIANKRQRRFEFTDLNKKEILLGLKDNIEKAVEATGDYKYKYTFGTSTYDITLLHTPDPIEYKSGVGKGGVAWHMTKMKGGMGFFQKYNVFLSEAQYLKLAQDQDYLVIGVYKQGEYMGKPTRSFNIHELIALADVNSELEQLRAKGL